MYYVFDFDLTLTNTSVSHKDSPIFRENKFLQKIKNDIISHLKSSGLSENMKNKLFMKP